MIPQSYTIVTTPSFGLYNYSIRFPNGTEIKEVISSNPSLIGTYLCKDNQSYVWPP